METCTACTYLLLSILCSTNNRVEVNYIHRDESYILSERISYDSTDSEWVHQIFGRSKSFILRVRLLRQRNILPVFSFALMTNFSYSNLILFPCKLSIEEWMAMVHNTMRYHDWIRTDTICCLQLSSQSLYCPRQPSSSIEIFNQSAGKPEEFLQFL